jgi:hypothetical protein
MSSAADAAVRYAPELPDDVIQRILAPLAGEVTALCVASCISTSWCRAAKKPCLWRALGSFQRHGGSKHALELTDARLAALVRRACSSDGAQHLESLDVTSQHYGLITARGVVAALCKLEGKLTELRVEGIISDADDVNIVPQLLAFLRRNDPYGLDIWKHLPCNAPRARGPGELPICSRLCKTPLCEECDIVRCCWCYKQPSPRRPLYFIDGSPPCEHICSECGYRPDYPDISSCPPCEARGEEPRQICAECTCFCETCDYHCCKTCAFACFDMVFCDACGRSFCERCAFNEDQLKMCHDTGNCATCPCYCDDCADEHLKSMAGWAEELQARKGEDAVDADVISCLLEAASLEDDSDDEKRQCEQCATRDALLLSEHESEEEDEAAAAS